MAEVVGLVGSIVGLVTAVKELIELSIQIRDSLKQIKSNNELHIQIVGEVIDTAETLKGIYAHTSDSQVVAAELQKSRERLLLKIHAILQKCRNINVPINRFQAWYNRGDYHKHISDVGQALRQCLAAETLYNVVAIRQEVQEVKELIWKLLKQSEKDPVLLETLIPVRKMTTKQMKIELGATKESVAGTSGVKKKYLTLKVDALTAVLKDHSYLTEPQFSRSSQSSSSIHSVTSSKSGTHRVQTADVQSGTQDAVLTILNLIESLQQPESMPRSDIAATLDKISIALADIGQFDEACRLSQEAVALFALERREPAQWAAAALMNYCNHLQKVGRVKEALKAVKEAVSILQATEYHSDLALAMNSTANCYGLLGRHSLAVKTASEVVEVFSQLCQLCQQSHEYKADLAMAHSNLADKRYNLGNYGEGLTAAKDSVAVYKELHQGNERGLYASEYASALRTFARCCSRVQRPQYDNAIAALETAEKIYRELAKVNPDMYKLPLADCLFDISQARCNMNQPVEACPKIKEATQLYQKLKHSEKGNSLRVLADTLDDACAFCFKEKGKYWDVKGLDLALEGKRVREGLYRQNANTETATSLSKADNNVIQAYLRRKDCDHAFKAVKAISKTYAKWSDSFSVKKELAKATQFVVSHYYRDSINSTINAEIVTFCADRASDILVTLLPQEENNIYNYCFQTILDASWLLSREKRHSNALNMAKLAVEVFRSPEDRKHAYRRLSKCYSDLEMWDKAREADAQSSGGGVKL